MLNIEEIIQESIDVKKLIINDKAFIERIRESAVVCIGSLKNGGKVHFCGNGGSAADAQHLAAELSGRYYYDRPPLNAEALHVNTSYVTAVANDYGYDAVYSRMLQCCAKQGDVLFAISTSGNSRNIVAAVETANTLGIKVIGLTGESGGEIARMCDILLNVPCKDTPRIQEAHIMIGHIICEIIESTMFPRQ